jgi:hypothetical protein
MKSAKSATPIAKANTNRKKESSCQSFRFWICI